MAVLDRAMAANLWNVAKITVKKWTTFIKQHDQSTFLGYANDVVLDFSAAIPGLVFQVRGFGVKILKGEAYVDFPQEEAVIDGETKYIPVVFPLTHEFRAVVTAAIHASPEVQSALEQSKRLVQPAAAATSGAPNPFTKAA